MYAWSGPDPAPVRQDPCAGFPRMRTGEPGRALCSRVSMCKLGARAQGEIREHRAGEEVRKGRGSGATLVRANRAALGLKSI